MNGIAVRHWDGYRFGKRCVCGDVFPHYWSTLNATAYSAYALATGDMERQRRAEEIVRCNLVRFRTDGSATCAFVYPLRINGEEAHYANNYANDQDWAIAFWYEVKGRFAKKN